MPDDLSPEPIPPPLPVAQPAGQPEAVPILEGLANPIFVLEGDGRFTYLNHAAERLWQRPRRELLGRRLWETLPGTVDTAFEEGYQRAFAVPAAVTFETFWQPLDCWYEVQAQPLPGTEGITLTFHDITRRKLAEAGLRENDERLQAIVDNAPILVYLKDRDGRYLIVNREFERVYGRDRAQILGRTDYEIAGKKFADAFREHDRRIMALSAPRQVEESVRTHDGQPVTLLSVQFPLRDSSGEPYAVCGISTDITAKKAVEEALRSSEERLRLFMESVQDYAFLALDTNGTITQWNPGVERVLGYTEAEIIGRNFSVIFTEDDRKQGVPEQELLTAQTAGSASDDRWHVRKEGTTIYVSGVVYPLWDEAGRLAGYSKVLRDMTAHKEAETRLRAAYDHERRIARSLQAALLHPPAEDAFPNLHVAMLYSAALEESAVGGDFFDAFGLPDGRTALVVGDISGKGLAAASRMAEIKFTLRAILREYRQPEHALERLNDYLYETQLLDAPAAAAAAVPPDESAAGLYVALAIAVIAPEGDEAAIAVAGAEAPLVLRADSRCDTVQDGGVLLGAERHVTYPVSVVRLAPGDTLILLTDGIADARRGQAFFGTERIREAARQALSQPGLHQTGRAILDAAIAFAGGPLRDDACLLLARRRSG